MLCDAAVSCARATSAPALAQPSLLSRFPPRIHNRARTRNRALTPRLRTRNVGRRAIEASRSDEVLSDNLARSRAQLALLPLFRSRVASRRSVTLPIDQPVA
eukprot:1363813-Pleurochrysis_carterae.AAC.1